MENYTIKCAAIIMFLSILITGCSSNNTLNTGNTSLNSKMLEQSLWFIDNGKEGKTYLEDDQPEVIAVRDMVQGYCDVKDSKKYDAIDFTADYSYYTDEFRDKAKKDEAKMINMFKENEVEIKHSSVFWSEISFNASFNECTAKITDQYEIVIAEKEFLDKNKLNIAKKINQSLVVQLKKQNESWKINKIMEVLRNDRWMFIVKEYSSTLFYYCRIRIRAWRLNCLKHYRV